MNFRILAAASSVALALSACGAASEETTDTPVETAAEADTSAAIAAAVAAPDRPADARELDENRKPAETLAFLGLEPGMDAADFFPGAGYWSEIMAHVVGADGSVTALEAEEFLGGEKGEAHWADLSKRAPGVGIKLFPFANFTAEPGSYDFLLTNLNYHDLYWESEKYRMARIDPADVVKQLYTAMRPGGIIGVIDHVGGEGDTREVVDATHRINPKVVIADFEKQGFELVGQSDILANPDDDHSMSVFDDAIRGKTDRFLLKFRKPAE